MKVLFSLESDGQAVSASGSLNVVVFVGLPARDSWMLLRIDSMIDVVVAATVALDQKVLVLERGCRLKGPSRSGFQD